MERMQLELELLGHLLPLGWLESSVRAGATRTQQNPSSSPEGCVPAHPPGQELHVIHRQFLPNKGRTQLWLQISNWETSHKSCKSFQGLVLRCEGCVPSGWDLLPPPQRNVQHHQRGLWIQAAPMGNTGFMELLLTGTLVPG